MKTKILLVTHKPFKIPSGNAFVPILAGADVALTNNKDGKISKNDLEWLQTFCIFDNSGENISSKNRLYSECSALYWAWKNFEQIGNPEYIGLMHYRRHFIFNEDYYLNSKQSKLEKALGYISADFINDRYIKNIQLNDKIIDEFTDKYDLIVSIDSDLSKINDGRNIRTDYAETIAGTKVKDFDLMLEILCSKYPQYQELIKTKVNGYKKSLYQMFIMKKELFFEYCNFLFPILFELEEEIDFSEYSTNGKRSLGYLAEELLAIFVWIKEAEENLRIKKLGCTLVRFPYEEQTIKEMLNKQPPSYFEYLKLKIKSYFLSGDAKQENKEQYQRIRNMRKDYFYLRKITKGAI